MERRNITWKKTKKGFLLLRSLTTQRNRELFLYYLNCYLSGITSQNTQTVSQPCDEISEKALPIAENQEVEFYDNPIRHFLLSTLAQRLLCRNQSVQHPSILLILHELSLTGAPVVGVQLAQTLAKRYGAPPVILALRAGPLQDTLEHDGITVITYENHLSAPPDRACTESFCCCFDAIIVNSLASSMFLQNFDPHGLPMAWWIHESAEGFRYAPPVLPHCFAMMQAVWWGSPNSEPYGREYVSKEKTAHLLYGVADRVATEKTALLGSRQIRFGVIGSLIPRKGQDILLSALARLSPSVLVKTSFVMVGEPYEPDMWPNYTKAILKKMRQFPNIDYHRAMSNDDYFKLLASLDVFICPSRDDPMPVVVTEALMCSKLCIISDAIGQAHLLNREEAMIVPADSPEALVNAITNIVNQPELIVHFAAPARAAYERFFSMEQFESNVMQLMDRLLACDKLGEC